VLDYLWEAHAKQIILSVLGHGSQSSEPRIRFIQIVSMAGPTLPASALRSSGLELIGSGIGSAFISQTIASIIDLVQAVVPGKFLISSKPVPLSQGESLWKRGPRRSRIVFTI
jgi:hypothetical protein